VALQERVNNKIYFKIGDGSELAYVQVYNFSFGVCFCLGRGWAGELVCPCIFGFP